MAAKNPYGDGKATERIIIALQNIGKKEMDKNKLKQISVIGLGYIGLPTAAVSQITK